MSERPRLPRSTVLIFYLGMTALAVVWGWLRGAPGVFWIGEPRVVLNGLPDEPWLAGLLLGDLVETQLRSPLVIAITTVLFVLVGFVATVGWARLVHLTPRDETSGKQP